MARSLIWIVQSSNPDEWIEVAKNAPKYVLRSNEHGTLRHWGLVERQDSMTNVRKSVGTWRATEAGRDFARGRIDVPSHVFIYNNGVLGFSASRITIQEALGEHFNFKELMQA